MPRMYSLNVMSIFGFASPDLVTGLFCFIPNFSQALNEHWVCTVKEGRRGKSLRTTTGVMHHGAIATSEQEQEQKGSIGNMRTGGRSEMGPFGQSSNSVKLGNQDSPPFSSQFDGLHRHLAVLPTVFQLYVPPHVATSLPFRPASVPSHPIPPSWPQATQQPLPVQVQSGCCSLTFPSQPSRPHPTAAKQSSTKPADLHTSVQAFCEVWVAEFHFGFQAYAEPDSGRYQQVCGSDVFSHFCLPVWVFCCWIIHWLLIWIFKGSLWWD